MPIPDNWQAAFDRTNYQAAFNKVAEHLVAQGHRCVSPRGTCPFRNQLGEKCSVGVLIPEALYHESMELNPSYAVAVACDDAGVDFGFLNFLRSAHDTCANWASGESMRNELAQIATYYSLDAAILGRLDFGRIVR
jgi:hypothetical protein